MNDTEEPDIAGPNVPEYSVSALSSALKREVEEAFPHVRVRGEISGLKFHTSGHVYFDLKDESAVLNAVVWRGAAQRLKVRPEQGIEVVCTGRISTYAGSSRYQLIVEHIELAGLGALMALLDSRRKKLAAEGLFDEARKKKLPFLPEVVGVITSPTGAVIRDILHRLSDRCPRRVLLWPVAVQGERAAGEIAAAIAGFNALEPGGAIPRPDVLIVARGGGSFEDLMPFNEEVVVRAAAASVIPLISAVGHETDTTLIDFASDRRAPTPTAAAEIAVPVLRELRESVVALHQRLLRAVSRGQERRRQELTGLARALPRADTLFALPRQRFDGAAERLPRALRQNQLRHAVRLEKAGVLLRPAQLRARVIQAREKLEAGSARAKRAYIARLRHESNALDGLARMLESVSYRSVLARGFALVRGGDGALRRRAASLVAGEHLTLRFADGVFGALAEGGGAPTASKKPESRKPKGGKANQGDLF
jgi:exodeoxyribonuclease VII large subunit